MARLAVLMHLQHSMHTQLPSLHPDPCNIYLEIHTPVHARNTRDRPVFYNVT